LADGFDPHVWRFVVRCDGCLEFVSLGEAPPIYVDIDPKFAELRVICPHCGAEHGYRQEQVSRQLQRASLQTARDLLDRA
jgi:predicted TIM-barrel fold metal-dependent hydrolase